MALELADRYHDLRRRQQPVRGLAFNASALLLKIPDTETGANPDIIIVQTIKDLAHFPDRRV
jgi:hypothetical protein